MKSVFTFEYEGLLSKLIAARKLAGLTQVELANRLEKPQSYVSKYERGERRVDVVELIQISKALGIRASEIVMEIETRQINNENS